MTSKSISWNTRRRKRGTSRRRRRNAGAARHVGYCLVFLRENQLAQLQRKKREGWMYIFVTQPVAREPIDPCVCTPQQKQSPKDVGLPTSPDLFWQPNRLAECTLMGRRRLLPEQSNHSSLLRELFLNGNRVPPTYSQKEWHGM